MHARRIGIAMAVGLLGSSGCEMVDESSAPAPEPGEVRDSMGTSVGPVSRAIINANVENDERLGLLARVEVQPNELIEFYEPKPGALMISSAGAPQGPPRMVPNPARNVEDWWRLAAGDRVMPSRLREAIGRSKRALTPEEIAQANLVSSGQAGSSRLSEHASPLGASPSERTSLKDRSVKVQRASGSTDVAGGSPGWCDNEYFSLGYGASPHSVPTGLPPTWSFDRNDWWNGFWAQKGGIHGYYANVCAATGDLQLKVTNSELNIQPNPWWVPVNTVRWSQYEDKHCGPFWNPCFSARIDVLHAEGDRFHVRFSTQ